MKGETDQTRPIVWIAAPFNYHVSLDWPTRREHRWIPDPIDRASPLTACYMSEREVIFRAPGGFDIPGATGAADPAAPELVKSGVQHIDGVARVAGSPDPDGRIRALRLSLDRPYSAYDFLRYDRDSGLVQVLTPERCPT